MTKLEKELDRIDSLPLHWFTKSKMRQAAISREVLERYPLSIHPRNWYLVRPDMYRRGDKSNTAMPPRPRLDKAA